MSVELSFGTDFLKCPKRLASLLHILSQSNRPFLIRQPPTTNSPETRIAYTKLKIMTGRPKSNAIISIKLWTQDEVASSMMLMKEAVNLILREKEEGKGGKHLMGTIDFHGVIIVESMEQLAPMLELSVFQLEKRCRMERILRSSQLKYLKDRSRGQMRELAEKYVENVQTISLKRLLYFLRFNTKWYLSKIRKCFTLWAIMTHQSAVQKMNEKIIKQGYLYSREGKRLLEKCFSVWKSQSKKKKRLY